MRESLITAVGVMAAGGVLALAFPRTNWDGVAWIAVAPLLVVALLRGPRAAFFWGWLGATTFFLGLLQWLNFTFMTFSAIPFPLTWLPTLALAAYCGLWVALVMAATSWVGTRSTGWALVLAPFAWVAAEWGRGHLFGGFPWGLLGYTQHAQLPAIQIAELGGVYAVSFVVLAVNAAVAGVVLLPWRHAAAGAVLAGVLLALSLGFGVWRLREPMTEATARVAVVQPSIEQPLKWDPDHAAATLGIYVALSRRAVEDAPSLLVWPETATPTPLARDAGLVSLLRGLATSLRAPLVVGSIDVEGASPVVLRNTAYLLTERGIEGRYDKMHLVPFGEYVPLSGVIGFVRGWAEFISELEPGTRTVVFPGPPAPFGVVICYEGIFPELVRDFAKNGARLIVNITNDAWFGRTSGPLQHLAMYPFRAVEHRTSVVRAANTGVSAFIAPTGQILGRLSLFERSTLTSAVPLRARTTLYTKLGDWVAYAGIAVTAVGLGVRALRRGIPR
ncbi:MAG: apolipoprotein N-acyltransferase [Candidatus Rokubacteria bacterium]|nr:apolipoprotein N-acyltransferase [Candidatus Rokubacteria bacterium]